VIQNWNSQACPEWLKHPNPKKPFRDEALTGERSAKSSDEDRPIMGMAAAHWKDEEPENLTPKLWDGNGIPNSTKKYKEVKSAPSLAFYHQSSKMNLPEITSQKKKTYLK
jgi:hypothetical protein